MALLNRPLTEAEARKFLDEWRTYRGRNRTTMWDLLMKSMYEPTPHVVRYAAVHDSVTYVAPTSFYWGESTGPSDCTWIVPGTHVRKDRR